MFITANCVKNYKDKNGNDFSLMVNEWSENFAVKHQYSQVIPEPGSKYICAIKPAQYEGKAFLAFDVLKKLS